MKINKLRNQKGSTLSQSKGFTIIEVLIVLAIAGLIMLIVFLAVPALQRNSRNTQRKNDASKLSGLVSEFVSNNNGKIPTAIGTGAGEMDLTNENFSVMDKPVSADIISGVVTKGTTTKMIINTTAKCNSGVAVGGGGSRSYTVTYQVETSSSTSDQCI